MPPNRRGSYNNCSDNPVAALNVYELLDKHACSELLDLYPVSLFIHTAQLISHRSNLRMVKVLPYSTIFNFLLGYNMAV